MTHTCSSEGSVDHAGYAAIVDGVIRTYPWMDFEIVSYRHGTLTIAGSIDPTVEPDLTITFGGVRCIVASVEWRTDTKRQVLRLIPEEDAAQYNHGYVLEIGTGVFQFTPENLAGPCIIGARTIKLERHKAWSATS